MQTCVQPRNRSQEGHPPRSPPGELGGVPLMRAPVSMRASLPWVASGVAIRVVGPDSTGKTPEVVSDPGLRNLCYVDKNQCYYASPPGVVRNRRRVTCPSVPCYKIKRIGDSPDVFVGTTAQAFQTTPERPRKWSPTRACDIYVKTGPSLPRSAARYC
jgi:hypothetical protein